MFRDDLLNSLIEKSNLAAQLRQQRNQAAGPERLGFHHGFNQFAINQSITSFES